MLASDIVVAASDCRFAQIEVKRGIMHSAGATIRMAERAGFGDRRFCTKALSFPVPDEHKALRRWFEKA